MTRRIALMRPVLVRPAVLRAALVRRPRARAARVDPARVRALRLAAPLLLVGVLALAPLRIWLEASMSTHMLMQMPLLAAAGFAFARALPARWRNALQRFAGGPVPLALAAMLASSYWMLPRALDAALVDPWAEAAKFTSLPLLAGAPLALAWGRLGPIGRGFVWTNFFSMLAVLGWLYIAVPVRVCSGYLVDQQQDAGWLMVQLALLSFGGWLAALLVGGTPAADEGEPSAAGDGNAHTHPA